MDKFFKDLVQCLLLKEMRSILETEQCQLHTGMLELVKFTETCPKSSTFSISPHKS